MVFSEPLCNLRGKVLSSLVNRPNSRKQFAAQHIFVKIALRTRTKRLSDTVIIIHRRNNQKPGLGKLRAYRLNYVGPRNFRQIEIHNRHVLPERFEFFYSVLTVRCFAGDDHIGLAINHRANPFPHPGVVINNQDADLLRVQMHALNLTTNPPV